MKNTLTLFLTLFLFPFFTIAQKTNCLNFKTGIFVSVVDGKQTGNIIKRDGEFQIEIDQEKEIHTKDIVQWIDDCSYRLISIEKNPDYPNLIIRITETGNDYYLFEARVESDPEKIFKGKMVSLK